MNDFMKQIESMLDFNLDNILCPKPKEKGKVEANVVYSLDCKFYWDEYQYVIDLNQKTLVRDGGARRFTSPGSAKMKMIRHTSSDKIIGVCFPPDSSVITNEVEVIQPNI